MQAGMQPSTGCFAWVRRREQLELGLILEWRRNRSRQPRAYVLHKEDLEVLQYAPEELQILPGPINTIRQYEGPGSELLKRLTTTARPNGTTLTKYRNIRPCKDSHNWQARLWLPGGCIDVGQHKHQVVAACIADDAAYLAMNAGLRKPQDINFDPVTRQMALQYLGVLQVPVPDIPPQRLEALKQGAKRAQPDVDSTTPAAAATAAPGTGSSIGRGPLPKKHHACHDHASGRQQSSSLSQLPQVLPQLQPPLPKPAGQAMFGSPRLAAAQPPMMHALPTMAETAAAAGATPKTAVVAVPGVCAAAVGPQDANPAAAQPVAACLAVKEHLLQKQPESCGSPGQGGAVTAPAAAAGQLFSGLAGLSLQQSGTQHAVAEAAAAAPAAAGAPLQTGQQQLAPGGGLVVIGGQGLAAVAQPTDPGAAAGSGAAVEAACEDAFGAFGPSPHTELVDAPSSYCVQWTEEQLDGCWLQAGQEVRLLGKACKPDSTGYTEHELLLRVINLRGMGATGEVYDVQVLQHTCISAAACGPAGLAPTAAAAAGPLAERQLSLKVCRAFEEISEELQDEVYFETADYLTAMRASMEQHHNIMYALGDYGSSIVYSHMFGSLCVGAAKVPALLMDNAGISLDMQLQQVTGKSPGEQGLGKQLTHSVMKHALEALCVVHDHGWAYLNIKPGHIVSSTFRHRSKPDRQWVQHALVDFSSALHVTAPGLTQRRLQVPDAEEYMSPEFLQGDDLTYKTDIWAVGILMFELRTGKVPHDELDGLRAESTHQETLQGMKQLPKYATLTQREWAFVTRCLAYDQQQRPTAEQLYEDDYILLGAS